MVGDEKLKLFQTKPKMATRQCSSYVIKCISNVLPELVGGSADLSGSNNTKTENSKVINAKIFSEESNEIIFKSFSDIISLISGTYYPPKSIKVLNLIKRIKNIKYNKSTLGGCIIEKKESFVSISKERKEKISRIVRK